MSDLKIFLNKRIEDAGCLSTVGNVGLIPLQYLCDGDKVTIATEPGHKITMHPIFDKRFDNLCMKMMKTLVAVALLIPGLILSLFKLAAYASSDVREKHALVKESMEEKGRFTRITRTIGTAEAPITSIQELERELAVEALNLPLNLTGALVIYGDGNLQIQEDPGILKLDPKRLILIGAKLVHGRSEKGCLDKQLLNTGNWQGMLMRISKADQTAGGRTVSLTNADASLIQTKSVSTLREAYLDPDDKMANGRPFRMVYMVPRSNPTPISLDDVTRIKISGPCATCYPCRHICEVSLSDGRNVSASLSAGQIGGIVNQVPPEKIVADKSWSIDSFKEHVKKHKAEPVEETLNSLDFA